MSFGPKPWIQQHWDVRAATNFMLGGTGSGFVVAFALAGLSMPQRPLWLAASTHEGEEEMAADAHDNASHANRTVKVR